MLSFPDHKVMAVVDQTKGSKHPDYGNTYPLKYGYIPG